MNLKNKLTPIFVGAIFTLYFFFNIYLLPHYGMSWDEPFHYLRGQIYLQYLMTGNGDKFNDVSNLSIYQNFDLLLEGEVVNYSYLSKNDDGHPPLNGILAALSNRVFYQELGVLDDIESYHLFVVFIGVFAVALVFFWTRKIYGLFAGIVSSLSIAFYPLFFAESHFNIKDPIEASFYAATLLFFYNGVTQNNWKSIIISSVFAGFALSTKFNIFFAFFTIFLWLVIYKFKEIITFKLSLSRKLILGFIFFPIIAFGILYASWPFLWSDPINNLLKIFGYYKEIGYTITYQPESYLMFGKINTYAAQLILYTTPIVILIFFVFGVLYSLTKGFKEKNKTSLFILFWLLIPFFRVSLPGAGIYGGVRQIMEYIPAMAILSGIGAKYLIEIVSNIMSKALKIKALHRKSLIVTTLYVISILSFLPITLKLISIHPNENVYFNPLIGGLKGAAEKNYPYWGLNLGSSYKQGIDWINKNAEKNASVALVLGTAENIPKISFREDLIFYNGAWSGTERKGEYLIEAVFNGWIREWYHAGEYVDQILKPVYEVKVDDVAILKVWKNDQEHTYPRFIKEANIDSNEINWEQDVNTLFIKLKNVSELMSISVYVENNECFDFKDGQVYLSLDNKKWELEKEPLRSMYKLENILIYPLVAKKAKYVKMEVGQTSCPFIIEKVNISYIKL